MHEQSNSQALPVYDDNDELVAYTGISVTRDVEWKDACK